MRVYGQRAGRLGIAIAVVCLPLCGAWCSYGHAPGRWIERDDRLEWQLFNPRCQLRRFVDEFATDRARQPVSILLIGDSTDRLVTFLGSSLASRGANVPMITRNHRAR